MASWPTPTAAAPGCNVDARICSRELRRVDDYDGLVELVRAELAARFGLTNAWLYVFEREDDEQASWSPSPGPRPRPSVDELPIAPVAGDWLSTALRRDEGPIVIPDARAVAGNPDVARRLDNRTVVNMPIGVVDRALGILGGGTFGDEGAGPDRRGATRTCCTSPTSRRWPSRGWCSARATRRARSCRRSSPQRQRLESLGLLAGGVAHDFNNLLTVIRASAGFIGGGPLTEASATTWRSSPTPSAAPPRSRRSCSMLGRHAAARRSRAPRSTTWCATSCGCSSACSPRTSDTDFVAGARLPKLRIDPHQLEQVLMNLALNARDAMPDGGRLTLETQEVRDQRRLPPRPPLGEAGPLRPADRDRHRQRDAARGRRARVRAVLHHQAKGRGPGSGSPSAWGIVQQHGGMIHCYSEVGVGTTFKIYLPVAEEPASDVGSPIVGAVPRGTERILVADDQPHVLARAEPRA